jgi:hypothetical protein
MMGERFGRHGGVTECTFINCSAMALKIVGLNIIRIRGCGGDCVRTAMACLTMDIPMAQRVAEKRIRLLELIIGMLGI